MSIYPNGIASTGVYDIFQGTNFSPSDVVRAIRDNYSPVNRTTMLNSLGYQVGLIQNFVNASYLGRPDVPVQNAYMVSGWAEDFISLSGTLTGSSFQYSWMNETGVFAYNKNSIGGVCGTSIKQARIELFQTGGAGYTWSGYWDRTGIFSENLSFENPTASASYVGTFKANKAHKLVIANPSEVEDGSSYSGILELYASDINIQSRGKIYLGATAGGNTFLTFCGAHLILSGYSSAGNIYLYNNLIPVMHGEKVIGDDTRYFKTAYLQSVESTAQLTGAPGGTAGFYATFGAVCGTNLSTGTNGLFIQADYVCGTYLHNKTLIGANKIALYQYQTGIAAASGYLQMMSGQLEFYSYNHGSGWVLTNF